MATRKGTIVGAWGAAALLALSGCEGGGPPACRQMRACCAAVEGMEGLGGACDKLARQTSREDTCRVILETVGHMRAERALPLPESCRLEPVPRQERGE